MEKSSKIKISKLKNFLDQKDLDGYILPSTDEYLNEYLPIYNLRLKWLTNFSGSNGLFFIIKGKLLFFTDSRYLLQAKKQLIKEFEIFDSSKVSFFDWIKKELPQSKLKIAVDTKINSINFVEKLKEIFVYKKYNFFFSNKVLVDRLWENRPQPLTNEVYKIPKKYTGTSAREKIKIILKKVAEHDIFLITSPESINWLLNIRGLDLQYTPVVFSRMIIQKKKKIKLFIDLNKINQKIKTFFTNLNIDLFDETLLEVELKKVSYRKKVSLERNSPYYFLEILRSNKSIISYKNDPCKLEKSIKNKVEIECSREAHFLDGIALANFFHWLDSSSENPNLDEVSVAEKLEEYRKRNKNFISLSFPTISASSKNASIIHYQPNTQKRSTLRKGEIYLCDSGGQYMFGTTDVTRTIIFGEKSKISKKIIDYYTRVLIGHINIAMLKFPLKTRGVHIDSIARTPLWSIGKDYGHGTGHGVGSFLGVHEGPQSISKALIDVPLKPGMIISNEPGYYQDNNFGIRLENLICVKESSIKGFLEFETLTLVPFQKKLINKFLLNYEQINWINTYHKMVYNKLSSYLNRDVKKWLIKQTKPI